ncbi:MAG: copper resistance protein NlpE N-terminal domain-containing protein [Phenylobacterium sp.]|uniref:copper resistance protein NlpE N-terminal domain-containing protein n=1 Tax=Phenylobacterium sp. TaxID=1871053 RepID=UPI002717C454|nr:copper resistance protein NlpE N-terminal domain-containing protein [Phenylobacterium sp.]MDO8914079.1 copper resistance protein NlpE N-terminal domain-containing protein [Phenylobacterium sp.]MDP3102629.1 copper resistance protein NlpE N-terminal domain-containing protein [Phenylobacterium sp.]
MKYLALALALLMTACSPQAAKAPEAPPAPVAAAAPSPDALSITFAGDLPCTDCPGLRTELTLTRDAPYSGGGTYKLVETYLERGAPIITTGIWGTLRGDAVDPDATVYELNPEKPEPARRHFRRVGDDEALKVLGGDRTPLPDSLPSTLKRAK